MLHHHLSAYKGLRPSPGVSASAHYAVGISSPFNLLRRPDLLKESKTKPNKRRLVSPGCVLVQLEDEFGEQVRCLLSPDEARCMAEDLLRYADDVEAGRKKCGMPMARNLRLSKGGLRTTGMAIAEDVRDRANKLKPSERRKLLKRGMALIRRKGTA